MTGKIKGLLLFLAGGAIGSLVTTIVLKREYRRLEQEFTQERLEFMRDNKRAEKAPKEPTEASGEDKSVEDKKERQETEKITDLDKVRYNKIARNYRTVRTGDGIEYPVAEDDEIEERDRHERLSLETVDTGDGPYVITLEQFQEEMDHYDKSTIYYYEDDDTLTDEGEEVITDVTATIGDDALDNFGCGSEDPEVVYVRNDKMGIDYEVIRLSKSYAETVLGYTKDDGRRQRRRDIDEQ